LGAAAFQRDGRRGHLPGDSSRGLDQCTPVANVLLTLSLTNGAGALAGTLATNTDSNGIAHFPNLSIDAAGLKQLAVGDASTTLVTNSANFTISPLSANKLVIAQQPPGTPRQAW